MKLLLHFSFYLVVIFGFISLQQPSRQHQRQKSQSQKEYNRILQTSNFTCTLPKSLPNAISLGNCQNQFYIMGVQMGTPGQYLNLALDIQEEYIMLEVNQSITQYKPENSTSFKLSTQIVELQLNNGQVFYGVIGQDILVVNQSSIDINSLIILFDDPIMTQYTSYVDGIIGFSFSNSIPNFLQLAANQNQILSPIFALVLSPTNTSYLYYGEIPQEISLNTTFIKYYSRQDYEIDIIDFYIQNNQYYYKLPDHVILSTTNPYFSLSESIYNTAMDNYFKSCIQSQSGMSCSCSEANSSWPTFTIMLAGVQIYLQPSSYTQYLGNNSCSFGFNYISDSNDCIILGLSFFYSYNVTFDINNKRIGLQGNLTKLQQVGQGYLIVSQYVMCAGMLGIFLFSLFLIWYLNLVKQYKPATKFIEFGISDRFLQN